MQKICEIAKDEAEAREALDAIWENNGKSEEILSTLIQKTLCSSGCKFACLILENLLW